MQQQILELSIQPHLQPLQNVFGQILRYNPEIVKVEKTLLNYEEVRNQLSQIIDSYFPLIKISDLDEIWRLINNSIYTLDRLAYSGNDILLKYQSQSLKGFSIFVYNRIHSNFIRQIEKIIGTIKETNMQTSRQEKIITITNSIEQKLKAF